MNKTILVMTPHLRLPGGVANFYKEGRKYFSSSIKYIYVSSSIKTPVIKTFLNGLLLIRNILKICFTRHPTLVLNPSLTKNAYWRDGVLAWIGKFRGKKVFIFWRGWNPNNECLFTGWFGIRFFRHTFLKAHKHIVLNRYVREKLEFLDIRPQAILTSNTIVDDSYFEDEKSILGSKKIILFLTRIEKYKGIYETLKMFEQLKERKDVELHIAGTGCELDRVKEYVITHRINNVKFLGYVSGSKKKEVYKSAYCYVFPSYSEGMPNSVLEAMANGLPIVGTNVGAIGDFFENQKMGYVFEHPVSPHTLKDACLCLLNDPKLRNEISEFNKIYANEYFRASKTIKKLEKIFHE
ncbi:glycosyltransferase family 4 protein [Sphingobacterium chuzhouense]|uniref:Glycosyltransferase family 4 protein n=1 Tax=Sphingobacterium chuzhouense TaxID=1742264 RepID=A0ABR7XXL4_9SPHI|nr:glycosyltransferase family 4 protein [Sphingobacterium chuzhouense]MBD1423800.1 glycosyltransferase family 4 protein [Sphingobacterium chuzhouense]